MALTDNEKDLINRFAFKKVHEEDANPHTWFFEFFDLKHPEFISFLDTLKADTERSLLESDAVKQQRDQALNADLVKIQELQGKVVPK